MKQIFTMAWVLCFPFIISVTTYTAGTVQEIQNLTNMLQAGDTLLVLPGWYDMNWNIQDRAGNANDWIVILADGDSVVISGIAYDNVIDIYNSSYIEFKGFDITASHTGSGIDGIKFRTTSHHFVIEDLNDYEYANKILIEHKPQCNIIFIPMGGIDLKWLAEKLLDERRLYDKLGLNVRVLPQLHKLIWRNVKGK